MKNIFFVACSFLMVPVVAFGACTETTGTKSYTSCKSGYYKNGNDCVECPKLFGRDTTSLFVKYTDVDGNSADKNTGGITSCYMLKCTESSSSGLNTVSTLALGDFTIVDPITPITPSTGTCYEFKDESGTFVFTDNCYYTN